MTRILWPLCGLVALTACGDRGATPSGSPGGSAGTTSISTQPWDAPSQAGLWRHATMVDGRPSASVLLCYAPSMGSLVPRSAARHDLRCDAAVRERVAGGWTRSERCTTVPGDERRTIRATVSGDMAAAFSVTTEVLDGDGARRAGDSLVVDTWLRMAGDCPEGLGPGQTRADGTPLTPQVQLAPQTATRPRATAPAASADPIGDLASGPPTEEEQPSEGVSPDPATAAPAPAAPAQPPQPAPAN